MINDHLYEAVHAESGRQAHIQKRVRKDTRGMRRKARRADKDDESGNRRDEKASEKRITKEGDHERSPLKICVGGSKEKPNRLKSS